MKKISTKKFLMYTIPITLVLLCLPLISDASTLKAIANALNPLAWVNKLVELALLPLVSAILYWSGILLDNAIKFALNTSYIFGNMEVINDTWKIIRDILNLFFIFALIWISVSIIVSANGFNAKSRLTQVIIAAIIINFSLYFTKVIIDIGNIFGNWLYSGILNTVQANASDSFSALIGAKLGLLKFWTTSPQNMIQEWLGGDATAQFINTSMRLTVAMVTIYVFAYTAVLFLARAVTILFLLILSPIGFAGGLLPQLKEYTDKWWKELIDAITFPITYLLLMYITLQLIIGLEKGNLFPVIQANQNNVIVGVIMPDIFKYTIIICALLIALRLAKDSAGQLGKAAGGLAGSVGGLLVGATTAIATGGAAFVARTAIGGTAARMASSEALKGASARGGLSGVLARAGQSGLKGVAKSSFDVRASGILPKEATGKVAGIDFGKIGYQKDGYKGAKDAKDKSYRELGDELKATDAEKKTAEESKWHKEAIQNTVNNNSEYKQKLDEIDKAEKDKKEKIAKLNEQRKDQKAKSPALASILDEKFDAEIKEIEEKAKLDIQNQKNALETLAQKIQKTDEFKGEVYKEELKILKNLEADPEKRKEFIEAQKVLGAYRRRETLAETVENAKFMKAVAGTVSIPVTSVVAGLDKMATLIGAQSLGINWKSGFDQAQKDQSGISKNQRKDISEGGYKNKEKSNKKIIEALKEGGIIEKEETKPEGDGGKKPEGGDKK